MENEHYEKRLVTKVSGRLKTYKMDYKLENVAYIWVIRNPSKFPNGRLTGAFFGMQGLSVASLDCVVVYSCDITDMMYAEDEEVIHQWTNPNWVSYTRPFYQPGKRRAAGGGRPKKDLTETA